MIDLHLAVNDPISNASIPAAAEAEPAVEVELARAHGWQPSSPHADTFYQLKEHVKHPSKRRHIALRWLFDLG